MIVPTLRVGMHLVTLGVTSRVDAERPGRYSHAERGNNQRSMSLQKPGLVHQCPAPGPAFAANGGLAIQITRISAMNSQPIM